MRIESRHPEPPLSIGEYSIVGDSATVYKYLPSGNFGVELKEGSRSQASAFPNLEPERPGSLLLEQGPGIPCSGSAGRGRRPGHRSLGAKPDPAVICWSELGAGLAWFRLF